MKDTISIKHKNNMSFEVNVHGHQMIIDTSTEFGGNNEGPKPKSLMLVALAGCTGMDVVSLLRKMRIMFEDFRINVAGNVTEEHPKHFDSMHITYIIKGKNIPVDKINSAIDISLNKYCGVSYTYKKGITLSHELVIEE
jgi:putative redox protein